MQNNFSIAINLTGQQFNVLNLTGQEKLSQPFHFSIDILSDLNQLRLPAYPPALLQLHSARQIAGVISKIKLISWENDHSIWRLHLVPRLFKLQQQTKTRLFLQQSIPDIVKILLINTGYSQNQLEWRLQQTYSAKPSVLQAPQESHLAFLQRLLAYAGIFYWCTTDENGLEKIIFADNNSSFTSYNKKLIFVPENGLMASNGLLTPCTDLKSINRIQPQEIFISNYDFLQSQSNICVSAKSNGLGNQAIYGAPVTLKLEAEQLAKRVVALTNPYITANTTNPELCPALLYNLNNTELTGNYFITALQHQASNTIEHQGNYLHYQNEIRCTSITHSYSAPLPTLPEVFTIFHAIIESPTQSAYLDDNAHYRLRYYFDENQTAVGQASKAIPRLQASGGTINNTSAPAVGFHAPLLHGAEVLLGCIQGDPDRPIIYATLPNPQQHSPITNQSRSQHRWTSHNANELIFDDNRQNPQLQLTNSQQQNQLLMNASSQPNFILQSQQGKMNWQAGGDMTIKNDNSCYESVGDKKTQTAAQNYQLTTKNSDIQQQAQTHHSFQAQQQLVLQAQKQMQSLIKNNLVIQTGKQQSFSAEGALVQVASHNGITQLQSAQNITVTGNGEGIIQLATNNAGIQLLPDGSITIYGNSIWGLSDNPAHTLGKINYSNDPIPTTPHPTPTIQNPTPFSKITLKKNKLTCINDLLSITINFDSKQNQANTHHYLDGMRCIVTQIATETSNNRSYQSSIRNSQLSLTGIDLTQAFIITLQNSITREALYCIAIDNQTCAPQVSITINPNENATTQTQNDNETTRSRTINLTILPPVCFFNFRIGQFENFFAYAEKANLPLSDTDIITLKHYSQLYFNQENDSQDVYRRPPQFTPSEIAYFKANGNNVTFFIHGYNVSYGQFETCALGNNALETLILQKSTSATAAHQWYLYINDNLNRATGQFDESDYTKYSRVIHIAWEGNPTSALDYLAAVPLAKYPGLLTAKLIEQLRTENIEVNVIAHSLGALVAMNSLQALAEAGQKLQHIFLWQAAIPDNVFSVQAPLDEFSQQYYFFPEAYQAAEKITVLYSEFDNVLGAIPKIMTPKEYADKFTDPSTPISLALSIIFLHELNHFDTPIIINSVYELANVIGQPLRFFLLDEENLSATEKRNSYYNQLRISHIFDNSGKILKATLPDQTYYIKTNYYRAFSAICTLLQSEDPQPENYSLRKTFIESLISMLDNLPPTLINFDEYPVSISETAALIITLYLCKRDQVRPAMGYSGPNLDDIKTKQMHSNKQLILGNQYDWLAEHSAMKIPSKLLMKHVYKDIIMNPVSGYKNYGKYSL